MRLNLSVKFFIAFLATSFMIVVIMVVAMQFHANRSFSDYIHKVEATRLDELVSVFCREYQNNNGWDRLRNEPEIWHELVHPGNSAAYSKKPPTMPSGFESYVKPPPPPKNSGDEGRPDSRSGYAVPRKVRDRMIPRRDEDDGEKRSPANGPGRNANRPVFGIEHRLTLFDEQKDSVFGRATSTEGHTLLDIVVNGKTVGWIGLRNENTISNPMDMAFLKQQSRGFYVVGVVLLLLAALVAFLLSRHLLAPVQALTQGTKSLTSRRFDTRIAVNTSDELGQLAGDFNQMAQTLEQYEQLRQHWISDIAHELRTPLSILQGEIEAMQDGIRETNTHRLESLHAEVVHLIRIVSNLHDLSLAESAALHIRREPVNLIEHVRASLQRFLPRFVERDIQLVDELDDMETIIVSADPGRLTQVFINLLENTLRYTDSPGRLTVRQSCTANAVQLQFADTKPAVPTNSLNRLFDRLYRVDSSRSRALGGSGLGLSICKTIIEAHNGKITAQHAASGGLQIEITLFLENKMNSQSKKILNANDT